MRASVSSTRAWPTPPWSLGQFTSLSASESRLRALQEVEEAGSLDTSQGDRVALFIDLVAEREDGTPLPPEVAARARVGVPLLSTGAAQAAQQEHERLQAHLDRFDQCTMEDRRAAVFSGTGDCALPDRTDVLACVQWAGAWPLGGWTLDARRSAASARRRPPCHPRLRATNGTLSASASSAVVATQTR